MFFLLLGRCSAVEGMIGFWLFVFFFHLGVSMFPWFCVLGVKGFIWFRVSGLSFFLLYRGFTLMKVILCFVWCTVSGCCWSQCVWVVYGFWLCKMFFFLLVYFRALFLDGF